MNTSKKYNIIYSLVGGMDLELAPVFINDINTINKSIASLYSHGDTISLTGSGAILYYLYKLGYNDLIEKLIEPTDLDFLLLTHERNSKITVPFIDDFKREQETHEESVTFKLYSCVLKNSKPCQLAKITSFDITIPENSISYHLVDKVNLINLEQLRSYYMDDIELRPNDNNKVKIIDQILERLSKVSRSEIIGPKQVFSIIKSKGTKRIPISYDTLDFGFSDTSPPPAVSRNLGFGSPDSSPPPAVSRKLGFGSPDTSPPPTVSRNLGFGSPDTSPPPAVSRNLGFGSPDSSPPPTVSRNLGFGSPDTSPPPAVSSKVNKKLQF